MQTKQDPREPVLLLALKIMLHAKLCLSVIMFLIYLRVLASLQKGCAGHCLVKGRGGRQVRLMECLNHTARF